MASDTERFAAEPVPTSYASWRYCIEVKCGIPLTLAYVRARIAILSDPGNEETERFARTYGRAHLERVLGWFGRAADSLWSPVGARATGPGRTDPISLAVRPDGTIVACGGQDRSLGQRRCKASLSPGRQRDDSGFASRSRCAAQMRRLRPRGRGLRFV